MEKARKERFYFARTDQGADVRECLGEEKVEKEKKGFSEEFLLRLKDEAKKEVQRKLDELKETVKKRKEGK